MKHNQCFLLILCLLLISPLLLIAQSPRFENYKILKNYKDVKVNVTFQDREGFIWLGTNKGLVKFDGVDFQLFTTSDSLCENNISSLIQDSIGNMWIGHKNGEISIFKDNKVSKFEPEEGLTAEEVSSFFIDNKGILWFSTFGEGVYCYMGKHRKRLYNLNVDDGLLDNYAYSLEQDTAGNIYIATDKGISVYNPDSKTFVDDITMSDGLPDNIVKHLIIRNNTLWIGMEDAGICTYNLLEKQFSRISLWEFGSLNNFIYLSDYEIWVSTDRKGIVKCHYDEDNKVCYSNYGLNNNLPGLRTRNVFLDREKNIWIGTYSGLSIRKNNNIEYLDEKDRFSIKNIFSFTIDNEENYWVASQEGLFVVVRNKMGGVKQKNIFENGKYKNYSFISLYKDSQGYIWAGTYGFGVFRINPIDLSFIHLSSENGLPNDNIIHITGNKHFIWFSTLGGGAVKYNMIKNEYLSFNSKNGLPSDYVYSIYVDSDNQAWISMDGGGVSYIDKDSIYLFNDESLTSNIIYSVIEDKKGNLWFNSSDKGVYKYDGKLFFNFNEENGLRTNFNQCISTDNEGNLIFVSNEGIDKYIINEGLFEYQGEKDGVSFLEPNLNAIYKDSLGNLWVGTSNKGILNISSVDTSSLCVIPKIFITKCSIFFNEIRTHKKVFKYNENHITFDYIALWYKAPKNLIYRYKLEGYDIDWNMKTVNRMVTYSNVPPGDYRFIVQVNSSGKWIESHDSEYVFRITPPFWKTTWFITFGVLVIILGIYLYIRIRLRNLRQAKELLEQEVIKRTYEIQKQKGEIENQRDEIEAQRNHVVKQRDYIEKQNKDITSSIQYASRIQNAALPLNESFGNYLKDYFIFFKPRDIVSGDFYYLNQKDDNIIVAAADCTGHGVPGAFMSILGISLLNQVIGQMSEQIDAGKILTKLRDEIKRALRQKGLENEAKDGLDISLCILNSNSNKILYAGAYNPLLLVRNKEAIIYKGDRMPIGIHLRENDYFTNHEIEVKKGDMIYLYTDGFQDQTGGQNKNKFLAKTLRALFTEMSDKSASAQKEILENTFKNWQGNENQVDDVLVMGFRV